MSPKSQTRATVAQVKYFRRLFKSAGLELPKERLRRFQGLSVPAASKEIQQVQTDLAALSITTYLAPAGMATARQLAYWRSLRARRRVPTTEADLEDAKTKTTKEMASLISEAMWRLQEFNDERGVDMPEWRKRRGLYAEGTVERIQAVQAARREAKRARGYDRQMATLDDARPHPYDHI
ncbi:hypothetical protein LG314_07975 [Agrococcus terreus]|uniref:hypothetical protein n=1 Tax=Agrococcus terreus TaxID=574649 RepID=UPI003851064B